ncbi:MAG: D-alanine--D-alanine ligase family protein [Bacteroidota bacterium]
MKENKKILVCYNEPVILYNNYTGKSPERGEKCVDLSETDVAAHIGEITENLSRYFIEVRSLAFNSDARKMMAAISEINPDIIFNLVESVDGYSNYESYVTGLYNLLGIPYTGNTPLALGTCLNKSRTKLILKSYDIDTPAFFIAPYQTIISPEHFTLNFPVIMKLLNEDASIGISEFSVVKTMDDLNARLRFLYRTYRQDVLIEEYVEGREFNVAIMDGELLPVSEIDFEGLPVGLPKIVTYEGKWSPESVYYRHTCPRCPAQIDEKLKKEIGEIALKTFYALGCRSYARVDIRLSDKRIPYVIEVNPNPDISADSGFARASAAAGMDYPQMLRRIALSALETQIYDQEIKV